MLRCRFLLVLLLLSSWTCLCSAATRRWFIHYPEQPLDPILIVDRKFAVFLMDQSGKPTCSISAVLLLFILVAIICLCSLWRKISEKKDKCKSGKGERRRRKKEKNTVVPEKSDSGEDDARNEKSDTDPITRADPMPGSPPCDVDDIDEYFLGVERFMKFSHEDFGYEEDHGEIINDKLFLSEIEIEKGSNEFVVFKGIYEARRLVSVKRLALSTSEFPKILNEITHLTKSDGHPSIIRCYGFEYDYNFGYFCLDPWECNLSDLIDFSNNKEKNKEKNNKPTEAVNNYLDELKVGNNRTALLQNLLREIVSGIAHLHEKGIVHRALKPENIQLISRGGTLSATISNMSISKSLPTNKSSYRHPGRGSHGWESPEQILEADETHAVDLFNLGCVIFYTLTGGKHPFGVEKSRDANIKTNNNQLSRVRQLPEASDLISKLLKKNSNLRPSAAQVIRHPMFWSSDKRLSFFGDASDKIEPHNTDPNIFTALNNISQRVIGGTSWDKKLDECFVNYIKAGTRKYTFTSTRHLLRLIRNSRNHLNEYPPDVQQLMGKNKQGLDKYFALKFPTLLMEVYMVLSKYYMTDPQLKQYFE